MPSPFYHSISQIRAQEKVVLYEKLLNIADADANLALEYLAADYNEEALEYPFDSPNFDAKAALWAAKTLYFACQFMLHRDLEKKDLEAIFTDYPGPKTPSAILSIDLCLRFLPDVISHCRVISPEDLMIPLLEYQLQQWHYSGIGYALEYELLDFSFILDNPCTKQLYINRIIEKKAFALAELPSWNDHVKGALGMHADIFWKQLL